LHVLYSFSQRFGLPGIGTTAWHQVDELVKLGIQVTLFCGSCEREVPGIHRVVETMRFAGIPLPYRLIGNERAFRFHDGQVARDLRRWSGQQGTQYDVIHCWPLGSLATLYEAKSSGIATVLERPNAHTAFAHEVVAREHEKLGVPLTGGNPNAPSAERLQIEEAEYQSAAVLACPSDFVAGTFLARGMDPAKIGRHQYGYDPAKFSPGPVERKADHPFTMLFVGRCEPRKGLHYALEAWHRAGAAAHGRFVICGAYVPGYREVLAQRLDGASVEERGYLADVSGEMRNADVLVLPSIEEGSALVTYEARASGCVLLVSEAAGAKLQDGRHGFVHRVGDVGQLAAHVQALISDRALLKRMRSASIADVDGLSWSAAAESQCAVYEQAIRIAGSRKNAT
jgi:glycosyltransferase involved in cell wall biosynthesis